MIDFLKESDSSIQFIENNSELNPAASTDSKILESLQFQVSHDESMRIGAYNNELLLTPLDESTV